MSSPACFEFLECDGIVSGAVNLVRAHVDERRFGAGLAGGFEGIEGADGVGVEIVEGDRGGAVVRRLGGSVDGDVGLDLF